MIRHIVFFSVRKDEDRETVGAGLDLLVAIPHGRNKEIGRNKNADALSERVDFVVYGEFADEAELAAYKAHPVYQRSIEIVRPLRELRIAADFESVTGEAVSTPSPFEARPSAGSGLRTSG